MSKILITGNGFDLFHHLPTKYHHFISVMQTIEKKDYNDIVSFEELFGSIFKNRFQYDFNSIVENYNVENIKFDFNKINKLKALLSNNLWYKHFRKVTEIDTWIDFEMEIENILNQVSILLKSETLQSKKINQYRDVPINYPDFDLFGIIEYKFDNKEIISIPDKYLDKRKREIRSKDIFSDLAKSFEDFIIIFNHYLIDVVSFFYAEIKQKSTIPFHLIDEIYSFNYTPSLENIYNVDKSKVVYLHGKINEDPKLQNLVLGVSEITQDIKISKIYDFTKYYQKTRKMTNNKFVELPGKKNNLNETVFYVFGHSLNESDKEYIIDLFKFLELDLNRWSKICVFYFDELDYSQKLNNLFSVIDKQTILEFNKDKRLYFRILNDKNISDEFEKKLEKNGLTIG